MTPQRLKKGALYPYAPKQTPEDIATFFKIWKLGAAVCLVSPRSSKAEIDQQIASLPSQLKNASTIIFTSGSSGEAKAVVHSLENHYFNAVGSNQNIAVQPGDRWLLSLPLYHVSGMGILWRCMLGGGDIVFPKKKDLAANISELAITHVSLVPTQLLRLLEKKQDIKILKKLKCILLGGAPIPDDLLNKAKRLKLPIYMTYGLTEMASQVATSQKPFGPLQPLDHRELKIVNNEILVRGKTLFLGYLKNGKLQKPFDKNGWFHTGDLGTFSKKEGLKILGRKDNMFISGGENIYPEEIEKALFNTGWFENAVVVPVKNIEFGFRPLAFIKPHQKQKLTATKIIRQLKKTLPSFKVPQTYRDFPKEYTQHGMKPDRQTLFAWLNLR